MPDALDGAVVSNDFPVFTIDQSQLLPAFMGWMCRTKWFVAVCKAASEGTTNRVRLQECRFLATQIPLPPLSEQRRIVARIEELAGKIEEARRLRWRAMEETTALTLSASNAIFGNATMHRYRAVQLGDVAYIQSGVTLGRSLSGPTVRLPYLRVANVQDGRLDLRVIKEVEVLPEEAKKWALEPGDVLLTEGGDWDKLGRGTVWRGEIPNCIHQNHIFRVRANPALFDPDYLVAVIGSPYGKAYFQAAAKQTTNLASINQRQLKAFRVFQPALDEQRQIVSHLGRLQAQVDKLKQGAAETAAELDALLPSVLDRAFSGGV